MNHIDLFSGIGGFALSAKWAGFKTRMFCENDKFCQKVLAKNFPNVPIHDDIKTFNYSGKIDLLTGGIPCQPFSVAGKRKGKKDDRYLWPDMFRIIRQTQPSYVLIENVMGIIPIGLDDILVDLERENYAFVVLVLPASAAQAPHKRERVWIIAHRDSERCNVWCDTWDKRFTKENIDRHVQALQSEWAQLKPQSWSTMQSDDWLRFNSESCRAHDGLSVRLERDRIRALGNAIVPQIAYPILKIIYDIENGTAAHELNDSRIKKTIL
jgi:DNA (cytosine-5)-methyltransferase 1